MHSDRVEYLSPPLTGTTRRSLVEGMKEPGNQTSWERFFDTYGRLILDASTRAGLTRSESEEVLQETALTVFKNVTKFEIDPTKGSFKNWLMRATHWRIVDQLRKRIPQSEGRSSQSSDETSQTSTIDRIPDPSDEDQAVWDLEWDRNRLSIALARVRKRVKEKHFQIFYLYAMKEVPLREVAQRLKANASLIYVTKYRIQRMLHKELRSLESDDAWQHGPEL